MARMDGALVNALTGMGTAKDKASYTLIAPPALLTEADQEALYMASWLCRRVVGLYASEATRSGWELALGVERSKKARADCDKLVAYGEKLRLRHYVREALRQARLYGGAAILMLVDDGSTLDTMQEEIRWKQLKAIKGFHVLDRYRIWPGSSWQGVGEPETYQFNTENDPHLGKLGLEGHNTITVHASRVLRIEGEPAPNRFRPALNWWGLSVLQGVWETFKRFETAQASAAQLLSELDVVTHKIPGLARMLAAGNEELIARRLETNQLARSVYGAYILGEDEELNSLARATTGIGEILESLKGEITGATNIPHTKLWGESPSGLGATGRSEDQAFAADVLDYQDQFLQRPLRQFYETAMKAQDAPFKGDPPDDWKVKFLPTFSRTMEETAELYAKVAGADSQWITAGVLQAHEVAVARFGRPDFSLETSLIDRDPDGKVPQEELDPNGIGFGGALAPPMPGVDGKPMAKPSTQPYPGPGGAQIGMPKPPTPGRTDAAEDDEEPCCESCARGEECEDDCPGDACPGEKEDAEGERETVGEVMHRWKHGPGLHSGTGKPGEHRNKLKHGPATYKQAVAIALSIAGKDRPAGRRGRRRGDSIDLPARLKVAGVSVDTAADGTGTLVGPYGQRTTLDAVVGPETGGMWEVLAPTGEWFAVLGVSDGEKVQAAAGADAKVRRLDGIDLAAMGVRCDALEVE